MTDPTADGPCRTLELDGVKLNADQSLALDAFPELRCGHEGVVTREAQPRFRLELAGLQHHAAVVRAPISRVDVRDWVQLQRRRLLEILAVVFPGDPERDLLRLPGYSARPWPIAVLRKARQ